MRRPPSTHGVEGVPTASPESTPDLFHPRAWAGTREGMERLSSDLAPARITSPGPLGGGAAPRGRVESVLEQATHALDSPTMPEEGVGDRAALRMVASTFCSGGIDLSHPFAVAHLQPPTLAVATAADTFANAVNASVDTYDSGPSGIAIERWVLAALAQLAGLGPSSGGVMTPGGTLSNLLALLLARDAAATRRGLDVRRDGMARLGRPVILCSEAAHFSIKRACAVLGLGERTVVTVRTDARHRIDPYAVDGALASLDPDQVPLALVATAGTTDFGSIDPLERLAAIARARGLWLHVDAAYGYGALFSHRLAPRLRGIELADSITVDLHKFGWQPAATSVLLVANSAAFDALHLRVDYLNPSDDARAGLDGLLGQSLQTTRRADAVKVAATLLAHGRQGLGRMVDACCELAAHAAGRIQEAQELELMAEVELSTVVFRYNPRFAVPAQLDNLNATLRRRLLESGRAVLGRTTVRGSSGRRCVTLKFTLINPRTTKSDVDRLLSLVCTVGRETYASLVAAEEPR